MEKDLSPLKDYEQTFRVLKILSNVWAAEITKAIVSEWVVRVIVSNELKRCNLENRRMWKTDPTSPTWYKRTILRLNEISATSEDRTNGI